jgi:carboxylesterase type B
MWNLSYIVQRSVQEEQPLLAVSVNYRLSFLGFPGGREAQNAGVTNLGLKDQRLALAWIQENIVAFGGDPSRVTIWGESAGGVSVAQQLVAYGGRGGGELFSGAIAVSGFATGAALPKTDEMQAGFDKLVGMANCTMAEDKLECLRGTSLYNLYPIEGSIGVEWGPVIDGDFLQRPPAWEIRDGNCVRVPLLLGSNSDEGLIKVAASGYFPNRTNETTVLLETSFPLLQRSVIKQLLDLYPEDGKREAPPYSLSPDFAWCQAMNAVGLPCGSQYRRSAAMLGDYVSHAPRRYMAQLWSRLGLPTYSFHFKAATTGIPIQYFYGLGPGFANHGAELAYEMGLPGGISTPIQFYLPVKNVSGHIALSKEMNRRWIAFVSRKDPNELTGMYRYEFNERDWLD